MLVYIYCTNLQQMLNWREKNRQIYMLGRRPCCFYFSCSSLCDGKPWLLIVCVLDVVIAFDADADACDVADVDGELVPDDEPTE